MKKEIYRGKAEGLYKPHLFAEYMFGLEGEMIYCVSSNFAQFDPLFGIWHIQPEGVTMKYFATHGEAVSRGVYPFNASLVLWGDEEGIRNVESMVSKKADVIRKRDLADLRRYQAEERRKIARRRGYRPHLVRGARIKR